MKWDQLDLFELPAHDQASPPQTIRITLAADLPGPGFDHLAVEVLNDALARLCHDSGLFANRVTVEIDLEYIDPDWFSTDTVNIANDTADTSTVNACTNHPHIE